MRPFQAPARVLLVMLAAALPLACGDDDPAGVDANVIGTYTLVSIGGATPPVVVFEAEEYQQVVVSGSITLATGGACEVIIAFQEISNEQVVDQGEEVSPCIYTVSGSRLRMDFGDGDIEVLTISGDTITASETGAIWIFRK